MPPRHDRDLSAGKVAVVAALAENARAAARVVRASVPRARLSPTTLPAYIASCGDDAPRPVVLAGAGESIEADRRFFLSARDRLLWRTPAPDVYDALGGLRTDLPPRRRSAARRAAPPPYLLMEGGVTAARARRALRSPVRYWIVENVGRVRIQERELDRLAAHGVRWSVLWPVRLLGVVDPLGASKGLFGRRIPIWPRTLVKLTAESGQPRADSRELRVRARASAPSATPSRRSSPR